MAQHLDRIIHETGVTPVVNQVELHPRFQQRELRAFHRTQGIATQAWSPLGQGQSLSDPTIQRIARKHSVTAAQVIVRWHLDTGNIAIPKSVNPIRIAENLDVFSFSLDRADLAEIYKLDKVNGRIGPDPRSAEF